MSGGKESMGAKSPWVLSTSSAPPQHSLHLVALSAEFCSATRHLCNAISFPPPACLHLFPVCPGSVSPSRADKTLDSFMLLTTPIPPLHPLRKRRKKSFSTKPFCGKSSLCLVCMCTHPILSLLIRKPQSQSQSL